MPRPYVDNSMYSGTPCDKCGGPTYLLRTGSIWCSAEDPHPGGHFVFRIGMTPNAGKRESIKPRVIKPRTSAPVQNLNKTPSPFGEASYDDFVKGSES